MSSERRMWAVIILLGLAFILNAVVSGWAQGRTARRAGQNRLMLLRLEAEATARRAGRPRSPETAPATPGPVRGGR